MEAIKASLKTSQSHDTSSLPPPITKACSPLVPIYSLADSIATGVDVGGAGDAFQRPISQRIEPKKLDLFAGARSEPAAHSGFMSPKIGQRLFSNKVSVKKSPGFLSNYWCPIVVTCFP